MNWQNKQNKRIISQEEYDAMTQDRRLWYHKTNEEITKSEPDIKEESAPVIHHPVADNKKPAKSGKKKGKAVVK